MILLYVLVGFAAGSISAILTFVSGGGFFTAFMAYAAFGALAIVLSAVLVALSPTVLRPGRHALAVEAQSQSRVAVRSR